MINYAHMIPALLTAAETQDQIRIAAQRRRVDSGLTQADLAARSGVSLGSLRRFEQGGEIAFGALLRLAECLDCLDGFGAVFPAIEARTLDEIERQTRPRRRVRKAGS